MAHWSLMRENTIVIRMSIMETRDEVQVDRWFPIQSLLMRGQTGGFNGVGPINAIVDT